MNSINLNSYNVNMGILIDIRPKYEAINNPINNAINIPYDELIFNHSKYLKKGETYFIVCSGGVKSKKAVNILSVYGYNAINVVK